MRRVLVPLDGSDLAESILPDARRLAGPRGRLILMRDASRVSFSGYYGPGYVDKQLAAVQEASNYVERVARILRAVGVPVDPHVTVLSDTTQAINEAVDLYLADMIAVATHGRNPAQRLVRGGVAWRALAHSTVPVLVRHADEGEDIRLELQRRRILVPLDGSRLAEAALPLAQELAAEWQAATWLVHVIPDSFVASQGALDMQTFSVHENGSVEHDEQVYLQQIADQWQGDVHVNVLTGPVVDRLVAAVEDLKITDIIMTSHGRTSLFRVVLGSVADALIHRLHLPILVMPPRAARSIQHTEVRRGEAVDVVEVRG